MNRGLAALLLGATWACEQPMVAPDPSVRIVTPAEGAVVATADMVVRIEDVGFYLDGNETARSRSRSWSLIPTAHAYEPQRGFADVRLDGVPVGEIHADHDPVLRIPLIGAGSHVIEVEMMGYDGYGGRALDPPVTDSVAFTAE